MVPWSTTKKELPVTLFQVPVIYPLSWLSIHYHVYSCGEILNSSSFSSALCFCHWLALRPTFPPVFNPYLFSAICSLLVESFVSKFHIQFFYIFVYHAFPCCFEYTVVYTKKLRTVLKIKVTPHPTPAFNFFLAVHTPIFNFSYSAPSLLLIS